MQRTGNTKQLTKRGVARTSIEYVCSCGHRGWSTHRGLKPKPLKQQGERGAEVTNDFATLAEAFGGANDDRY